LSEKTVRYIAFDLLDTGWNRRIIRRLTVNNPTCILNVDTSTIGR